ncbi:MAG TPA: helix-turn-helix domain-containing protein [Patescibacteria group bacterium]|nr:helix-turn-helix domain-containing protein [Patescibacteria group bacterium]
MTTKIKNSKISLRKEKLISIFMNEIEKLFTIDEIAKILRVHPRTVNRYIESGRLKASKLGVWRIKQSDLNAFLEETSNTPLETKNRK